MAQQSEMLEALSEAEASADRLASESEAAQAAIEELLKRVNALDQSVEKLGDESKTRLQQLLEEFDKVQHELDDHCSQIKQGFAELVK